MTCPSCGLENPPSSDRCDCGYAFTKEGRVLPPRPASQETTATTQKAAPRQLFALACCIAFSVWWFWPTERKAETTMPRANDTGVIGAVVSVSRPSICAPSEEAFGRIMEAGAIDKEEFLRAAGREARRAGWEGPIFLASPDRVKVLHTSFTKARVRVLDEKYKGVIPQSDDNECWVPIETVRQ
jgi:hypothetical protein